MQKSEVFLIKSVLIRYFPRWLLLIAWGVTILWLSVVPSPPVIHSGFLGWDKFQHAAAYGVFTLFAGWAFACLAVDVRHRWMRAVVIAVVFGALMEVVQGLFTTTRTAELGDLLADLVGAVSVYCSVMAMRYFRKRL